MTLVIVIALVLLGTTLFALIARGSVEIPAQPAAPEPPTFIRGDDPAKLEAAAKRQAKEQRKIADGKRVFIPHAGYVINPLLGYPRNLKCVCGSGRKFKACCIDKVERYIPKARAKAARKIVEMAEGGSDIPAMVARAKTAAGPSVGSSAQT